MIVSTNRKLTLDEYLDYDDGTDTRYELEDGVLVEMGSEAPINSTIAMSLALVFGSMGIAGRRLSTGHDIAVSSTKVTVRKPDLIVHTPDSAAAILSHGAKLLMPEMPLPMLVVEVVSSSGTNRVSKKRDYIDKRDEYEARGIPEYWLVDPIAGLVVIFSLSGGTYESAEFRGAQPIVSVGFPDLGLTAEQILTANFEG
jgi:Uma2 family endonuclease